MGLKIFIKEELIYRFVNNLNVNERVIQVLPIADGWGKVIDKFISEYVAKMRQFPERRMILLIDFDQSVDRFS